MKNLKKYVFLFSLLRWVELEPLVLIEVLLWVIQKQELLEK